MTGPRFAPFASPAGAFIRSALRPWKRRVRSLVGRLLHGPQPAAAQDIQHGERSRDPFDRMQTEVAQIRRDWPVDDAIAGKFLAWDREMFDTIRAALLAAAGPMFAWEGGEHDLEDHIFRRLEHDRVQFVPWISTAFRLDDARVLEIGCGTGASTVALAEQGCRLTAIDIDGNAVGVARTRCQAMGLPAVDFRIVNAVDLGEYFAPGAFDCVIYFASLEHMTVPARRTSLAAAWALLPPGGHLVITDAPNRLWYFDEHTARLPFFHWLPDEMAAEYMQKFSSRKDLVRDLAGKGVAGLAHAGRGVSFHDLDLAIAPVGELQVLVGKDAFLRTQNPRLAAEWAQSEDGIYSALLHRLQPGVPAPFFERSIEVIIRK